MLLTDPTLTLADQLIWIVDLCLKTLAPEACKRRIGWLSGAIWNRVRRFEREFCALYAMWKAGTLPPLRSSESSAVKRLDRGERREAPREGTGAVKLPRGFAWMHKILPMSAGTLLGGVESLLLERAEMKAFVAEVPQAGRMLRPICTMVGMKPPEWLALPKRRRVRKKAPSLLSEKDEAELRRITALFPDIPAGRAAKRVWRRMFEGKPVDLTKLSAVALGLVLHAPRDGNCPPPEIGYGGRSFPRLPKDYVPPKDWE
jgi:hypothetical protein